MAGSGRCKVRQNAIAARFRATSTLPDSSFTPTSRFGGWMFHIWLWEQNPSGMFGNFNASVPLCVGSTF